MDSDQRSVRLRSSGAKGWNDLLRRRQDIDKGLPGWTADAACRFSRAHEQGFGRTNQDRLPERIQTGPAKGFFSNQRLQSRPAAADGKPFRRCRTAHNGSQAEPPSLILPET